MFVVPRIRVVRMPVQRKVSYVCLARNLGFRLVGWLVGWLAGWLAGWLVGWLFRV